jgi:hypothetical protein
VKTNFIKISKIKVVLNKKQLQKEVFVGGQKVVIANIAPIVERRIRQEQDKMVEEFEDHPVSQEIWAGETASNTSGLLGGYGNLFSFIGFDEGSDPISPISFILREKIPFKIKRANDYGRYNVTIDAPSKARIYDVAKVDWMGGRSWADGIENGIAGLSRYLYDEDYGFQNSLSGTGIQARNAIRGVSQGRTKYLSLILSNFKKRLSKLL